MSRPFTNQEVTKVFSAFSSLLGKRDKIVFSVQLYTGLRITDVLNLTIFDVFDDKIRKNLTVYESKTGKKNVIPITGKFLETISYWVDYRINTNRTTIDGWLFLSLRGDRLSYNAYLRSLKLAARIAGVRSIPGEIGTHSNRKWFGNYLLNLQLAEGVEFIEATQTVRKTYNHDSMDSTTHYLGMDQDNIQSVRTKLMETFAL